MSGKRKICTKCKIKKELKEFSCDKSRKDDKYPWCKVCATESHKEWYGVNKEQFKEQQREYRVINKEKIIKQRRDYRETNRDKILIQRERCKEKSREQRRKWLEDNKEEIEKRKAEKKIERDRINQEKYKKYLEEKRKEYQENKEYYREQYKIKAEERRESLRRFHKNHPEKRREYYLKFKEDNPEKLKEIRKRNQEKELNTPMGKLNYTISRAIGKSLQRNGGNKNGSHWEDLVGYSLEELKNHLEKQFKSGMTWENRGVNGWHIDHIIPKSAFKFNSPDDIGFKRCWSLKNLQPLWKEENEVKSNKLNISTRIRLNRKY